MIADRHDTLQGTAAASPATCPKCGQPDHGSTACGTARITITAAAKEEIFRLMADENYIPAETHLRMAVLPGGCSGFKYELSFEENPTGADDAKFEANGIKMVIDEFSGRYVNGAEIDYTNQGLQSGFKFTNPNATGGCGCGTSFTV